ncbi:hypothetical protein CLAFUW4_10229 [Fulvia fulva]|uniref:Uncharacterized protein n=1 Tax=Passalora fulva TaxID=5499 RepID=A0A9Q8P8A9_PASFU|nr:uncharacterized protein CLAFUR5_04843 [Fulvia fulva]KAK4616263.1 hypothetical protein CLAFUR4_10233 [Fulvia fulva]KAK4616383.1 hypothetical protein CLAFUR0_10231 [Fulvia fulva]UJO16994.1 hypothetical protein CLAFUR5_04843 [Fulvia fulva]WPV18737.1 hypothetical protein CLAFUW4_10229 [Fulvia fulva]WPV34073.1 hypothetical protein CLAFUW7_10229 [Fulvia fulva]
MTRMMMEGAVTSPNLARGVLFGRHAQRLHAEGSTLTLYYSFKAHFTYSLCRALSILGYENIYHGLEVANALPSVQKAWTLLGRRKWGPGAAIDGREIRLENFDALLGHCEAVTDQTCACSISATFGVYFRSASYPYFPSFSTSLYWFKQVFLMYEKRVLPKLDAANWQTY